MKTTLSILIAGIGIGVSVFAAESSREPLADPIPEKIVKGDITIAPVSYTHLRAHET